MFFYLFTFAISLWHQKFVTADITAVCVNNQHGKQRRGQDFDKNTKIHSANTVTRVEEFKSMHWKCNLFAFLQFVCIFSISAEYLQKIKVFDIPRWCSNMPKVRWVILCGFVANFTIFPAVHKFWKSVTIWQSYREFKGGNFFQDTVYE